jgi:plastocyanin
MKRAGLLLSLAMLVTVLLGASALATTTHTVKTTSDNRFSPKAVTIGVGDTVHWHNASGKHNVVFNDGSYRSGKASLLPWDAQYTFNVPGTYRYYCEEHSDGKQGMTGTVVVTRPKGDTTPPKISSLSAKPSKLCTQQSSTCQKPGTSVRFSLSEAARVKAQVMKNGKVVAPAFDKQLGNGGRSVKFSGKGLAPGKYALRLRATDAHGNASKPATTNITVAKS